MVGVLVIIIMKTIKRILVIRLSSIGDIILTTPLIRRLTVAYPDAVIDYCTKPGFYSLLASNPRLSAIYTTEALPSGHYDLVVDLQNNVRSRAIVHTLQPTYKVFYRKENWKKWLIVNFKINLFSTNRSVVDRYHDTLAEFCVSDDQSGCELHTTSDEKTFAAKYFDSGLKTLALCFGANHFTKRYPPKHFASILELILAEKPLQVLLLGGKEDSEQAAEIINNLPDVIQPYVINLAGTCTLMQSAAIIERCEAVLCNDTGLMHMASSFGTKLFVIFGSSSSVFGFLPYHSPYELFEVKKLYCRPCSHIGRDQCPKRHFRCMNELSQPIIARKIIDHFKECIPT